MYVCALLVEVDTLYLFSLSCQKMTRIIELLEFLNTLIHSIVHNIVEICKGSLSDIQTYLQCAQDII